MHARARGLQAHCAAPRCDRHHPAEQATAPHHTRASALPVADLTGVQDEAVSRRRRYLWSLPWLLAMIGLAVPMIGGRFIGWPFVAGWFVLLVFVRWLRPSGVASRAARLGAGVLLIGLLALLGTVGGFYLVPSVVAWMALVAWERDPNTVEHAS